MDTDTIDAQVDRQAVEFIRAGYAGASLHFSVEVHELATFKECAWAIGGYNDYDPATVADLLGDVLPECGSSVDIGREYSPVMYVTVPFHTHQTMAHDVAYEDSCALSEDEREMFAARIMLAGKLAGAQEYTVELVPQGAGAGLGGRVSRVRLWWD